MPSSPAKQQARHPRNAGNAAAKGKSDRAHSDSLRGVHAQSLGRRTNGTLG
jgi:hypothetical protein